MSSGVADLLVIHVPAGGRVLAASDIHLGGHGSHRPVEDLTAAIERTCSPKKDLQQPRPRRESLLGGQPRRQLAPTQKARSQNSSNFFGALQKQALFCRYPSVWSLLQARGAQGAGEERAMP